MSGLLHALSKSEGLKGIAVLGGGNILGTTISALAIILFSRFLGPVDFGLFSAAFAVMQIIVRVADLGINLAAERHISRTINHNPKESLSVASLTFWLKIAFAAFVITLAYIISPALNERYLHLSSLALLRIAVIISLGTIFFEYTTLLFQATGKFAKVGMVTIAQAIGKLVAGLILIKLKLLTPINILLVYGLMPLFGALIGWFPKPLPSFKLSHNWPQLLRSLGGVAKWTALSALAATLADNIDILMVQSLMTPFDTGLWAATSRIAAFISIIGWSIGTVLNNRVSKYEDKKHLDHYLQKAWKFALLIFASIVIFAFSFSDLTILFTVGREYQSASSALTLSLIASAVAAATSPFVALFFLFDKPSYYASAGFIQTALLLLGNLILIPTYGLLGAASVRIVVKLFVLIYTLFVARRSYLAKYGQN